VEGHYQIENPLVEGDKYLYVEIGGDPPEEVTLDSVTYDWHIAVSDALKDGSQLALLGRAIPKPEYFNLTKDLEASFLDLSLRN
jgi:hypothetical protein